MRLSVIENGAKLVRVVDGDTIDLDIDLGFYIRITERVRLKGVNTPEIFRVRKERRSRRVGLQTFLRGVVF